MSGDDGVVWFDGAQKVVLLHGLVEEASRPVHTNVFRHSGLPHPARQTKKANSAINNCKWYQQDLFRKRSLEVLFARNRWKLSLQVWKII